MFMAAANRSVSNAVLHASTPKKCLIGYCIEIVYAADHGQTARPKGHFGEFSVCYSWSTELKLSVLGFHMRLCPINSIKGLVEEETNRPAGIHPSWHILIEGRIVP